MTPDSTTERPRSVIACPACGSRTFSPTGAEAPGFSTFVANHEYFQPPYTINDCCGCGLLYRTPVLSECKLSEYYSKVDHRKWETGGFYPTERAVLAILRSQPRGSRFLDFGCSSGRLLAPLVHDYQCCGFEINQVAAAEASQKGLLMLDNNLFGINQPPFDAIIIVDVFEHLADPRALLKKLFQCLKPGGLLILVTGNGDAHACRLSPAQFWYFRNVEHLIMLTKRSALFLADYLGANLESWSEMSHYDFRIKVSVRQHLQHFAYWQFQQKTWLAKAVLPFVPGLRRAGGWVVAPGFVCSSDHVVAVLRKTAGP